MTTEYSFLPRDPEKALFALKEKLYERLNKINEDYEENRSLINKQGLSSPYDHKHDLAVENSILRDEIEFLKNVLDMIERS